MLDRLKTSLADVLTLPAGKKGDGSSENKEKKENGNINSEPAVR
jgi:hypothetical protein